jgi:Maltokinase N-terminal cap domain
MAIIHDTTMNPEKLDLLATWLPAQSWYLGGGRPPALAKAGGFRLDDPRGEVGIEFMIVTDGSGDQVTSYLVPMTYRAESLAAADGALIGTSEHGVLGHRWIYDGARDPVLVAQLVALLQGTAAPQAQSVSNTPDPTVTVGTVMDASLSVTGPVVAADGPSATDLLAETAADGARRGQLTVRVNRILRPAGPAGQGLTAAWRLPDGTQIRGILATAEHVPGPRPGDH